MEFLHLVQILFWPCYFSHLELHKQWNLMLKPEYIKAYNVNTIAANALAPCIATPSAAMILTM